jgi:hypothetical protein
MSSYTDILNKRARTWPYGTEKQVKVIHADEKKRFIICADGDKEAYVLLYTDTADAKENDRGVITFTQGGPLGGYWKFTRSVL